MIGKPDSLGEEATGSHFLFTCLRYVVAVKKCTQLVMTVKKYKMINSIYVVQNGDANARILRTL